MTGIINIPYITTISEIKYDDGRMVQCDRRRFVHSNTRPAVGSKEQMTNNLLITVNLCPKIMNDLLSWSDK